MLPLPSPLLTASAAGVTDPYFANVSFLHGWETPSTTTGWQNEESSAYRAGTIGGSFVGPVATGKFGALCLNRNSGGFITYPNNAAFQFGSGAFTLERWVKFNTAPGTNNAGFFGLWDTGLSQKSWGLGMNAGSLTLFLSSNGSTTITKIAYPWSPSTNTWYYVGADFDGTTYRLYVGTSGGTATMVGSATGVVSLFNSTSPFAVGTLLNNGGNNSLFDGWSDEDRITKAVARYASNSGFSVPTAAFPRS